MLVVEQSNIELDYCPGCKGLWFDADEQKLFSEALEIKSDLPDISSLPLAQTGEKKRQCPRCGKKMDKVHMGKEPMILVDRCPRGHGLWFDGGELAQVMRQQGAASHGRDQRVIQFLGEVLSGSDEKGAPER